MDLRRIFDRVTEGYMVDGADLEGTMHTLTVQLQAPLDYGVISYARTHRREAVWAGLGIESRIETMQDGKTIVYVSPANLETYLRRWMRHRVPKPEVSEDGSVYDVLSLEEDDVVALMRATYCMRG